MKKASLLLIALLSSMATVWAADFQEGGMYFTITSSTAKTVEVAPQSTYATGTYAGDVVIPETVTHDGTTYTVTGIAARTFSQCTSLTSVVIPNTIAYIGLSAFQNTSALKAITLPDNLESIANLAFSGTGLTEIVIPDKVPVIGQLALASNFNLKKVTLGKGVHTVDERAFNNSTVIEEIVLRSATPPMAHTNSFANFNATLWVPASAIDSYIDHEVWGQFASIQGTDDDVPPVEEGQQGPVQITSGWNADVVAEALPAATHTNIVLDDQGWVFYSSDLFSQGGLPADGKVVTKNGNSYQLAPYDEDNAVTMKSTTATCTLVFAQPQQASSVQFLAASANGTSQMLMTVHYDDETTQQQQFFIDDWFSENANQGEAVYGLCRVITRPEADWKADDTDYRYKFRLFENAMSTDKEKVITAVSFASIKNGSYPTVLAVSRIGEDAPTAIESISFEGYSSEEQRPADVYDLQGRRITKGSLQKGLYIVGGRKVVR